MQKISSPYHTDGLLENGVTILMEFKYNIDLTKRIDLSKLLVQQLYYLKQFESHGDDLPSVIFGADNDECFCMHVNDILKYLDESVDWSISPSEAPEKNPELVKKIYDDDNIKPFIFRIDDINFDFSQVTSKIKQLNDGIVQKVRITELNINRFFRYFVDKIIKNSKKYSSDDLVAIFLGCLIDKTNNYPHPRKKNCLVVNVFKDPVEISINSHLFDSFFNHFETEYTIEEKKRLTSICDRLVEDEARRFRGEFYTPTDWVNEAHKMIEETFGLDWKEKYVVWDPAWGTGNLTRDYKFKELYCSTLNHGDLEIGKHYNPEAVKFQYDFLNDDVTPEGTLPVDGIVKLPTGLVDALMSNKPIIIFMNPPYAKSSGMGKVTKGASISRINEEMVVKNMGKASSQLYCQFLYRCIKFVQYYNVPLNIATFSSPLFLTGQAYENFRKLMFDFFEFNKGFLFNASDFSNVSNNWGVMFSCWSKGKNTCNDFVLDVKTLDKNFEIQNIFTKTLYNTDNVNSCKDWVREELKGVKRYLSLTLKNPLKLCETGGGTICDNFIGYMNSAGNNVYQNISFVGLYTLGYGGGSKTGKGYSPGFPIILENFMKSVAYFTARKTIKPNWINQKDEYIAPNTEHPDYSQWNSDAIVYSLFNGSSNQSSLRKITYKDKLWDIKNQWFWMSNEEMKELASKHNFEDLYYDANGDEDRFVYKKLQEVELSEDAKEVLEKARELVIKTFPFRQILHEQYPEWHLNTWDAGWYQIKLILKSNFKNELEEFNELYNKFEDRMREGVYKFGFLK